MVSPNQPSSQDIELLSAYIDDALSDAERASLESRLQREPALQRELNELRVVVQAVRALPPVKAPRNFTLTADMVALPEPEPLPKAATFLLFPTSAMFSALSAAAATVLILFGVVILFIQASAPPIASQAPIATDSADYQPPAGVAIQPTDTDAFSLDPATLIPRVLTVTAVNTASPTPQPTQTAPPTGGLGGAQPQPTSGIVLTAFVEPQMQANAAEADTEEVEVDAFAEEADDAVEFESLDEAAEEPPPAAAESAGAEAIAPESIPPADDTIAGDEPLSTPTPQPTNEPTQTATTVAFEIQSDGDAGEAVDADALDTEVTEAEDISATATALTNQQRSELRPTLTASPSTRSLLNPTGTIIANLLTPAPVQTRAAATPAYGPPGATLPTVMIDPDLIAGGVAIVFGLLLLGLAIATTVVRIRSKRQPRG